MFVALLTLIGMIVFVSATITRQQNETHYVEVYVEEGWNLIAGIMPSEGVISQNSEIKIKDIKVIWFYSNIDNKYVEIYPILDEQSLQDYDDDFVLTSSMWVYVEKSGELRYSTMGNYPILNERQLISGWNFLTILPEITQDLSGSCNIEKSYFWDIAKMKWSKFPFIDAEQFTWEGDNLGGYGLIIKVSSDCILGSSSSNEGSPPGLPSDGELDVKNTELRKMIEDYYYGEFSYEECDLNNAQEYTSVSDCYDAWKCLAKEYAKLIPKEDLEDLVGEMSEHGGESGSIYYHEENPSVNEEMRNSKFAVCLSGVHEGY